MGSNAFFDFINDCDIADQDTCTRAEIEMCFIASSSSGPKTKWNTRRNLFRFQFIETIAYLALSKFLKSKRVATASEAIITMLSDHIATNGAWHDSQAYRTGLHHSNTQRVCLYSIRVDAIFKEHLSLLKDVFSKFAGSLESVPSQLAKAKRMSFSEFMLLCDQVHMVDESLPAREVKIALVRAKETELFDPERDMEELKKINFGEFIETCARIADAKDLTSFYDKILMDSLKVHSSSRDDWSSLTGCLSLKLPVILKQLCIPAVRERKISIPPLMVKQISYIASAFVVSG
ncbi:Centrosomal protein of 78 kDa [Aphanomyces cochlioides]|nr:Centrosomal protein of 78 kDa [Aphanomyces cochlioides]